MCEELITGAGHLMNTGGPYSRVRSEKIKSSILDRFGDPFSTNTSVIMVPQEVLREIDFDHPQDWVAHQIQSLSSPPVVPTQRCTYKVRLDYRLQEPLTKDQILTNILILGKCNDYHYDPHHLFIPTLKRLSRIIQLITFKTHAFYELD